MYTIALIDSGVGGLSIYNAIKEKLPESQFIYLGDHAHAPYGDKSHAWLQERTLHLARQLQTRHDLDCIIIACNTASTVSLSILREHLTIPVVGVVPAIKTAASLSNTHCIGVLATPTTINGVYIEALITQFASHCHVTKIASTELVTMAENKLSGKPIEINRLKDVITPFLENNCDKVVLGCTHFPLLLEELKEHGENIQWIDSAQAIASRCTDVLKTKQTVLQLPKSVFYSTNEISEPLRRTILTLGFNAIKHFK